MLEIFKTAKLYIYAAILAAGVTFWLVDRHAQFDKGVAYQEQQQQAANTKEVERQIKEHDELAAKAVQAASEVAEHITTIKVEKPHEIAKTKELAIKANTPASCDLSDDELRDFNQAISNSNK